MDPKLPQINIEQRRQNFAEKVKVNLEKYKDKITQFNLLTSSKNAGGFFGTNDDVKQVNYDSRYENFYKFHNIKGDYPYNVKKSGYVIDNDLNKVTLIGVLGRTLLPGDNREGNGFYITLKFDKEFKENTELINSISNLLETLVVVKGNDETKTGLESIKEIAKEGIVVLEAFEKISEKFPSNGRVSIKSLIEEYREIINS